MTDPATPPQPSIPSDDPHRHLTIARPDEATLPHIGLVGDTYTILVSGDDTAGKYTLIDMHVPPGGGHRLIVTTSRRCSRSSKAKSSSAFATNTSWRKRARLSTSRPTCHTLSETPPAKRLVFSACVPRPDRKFSLAPWALRSHHGPNHRPRSTRTPRRRSLPDRNNSHPNTERNSYCRGSVTTTV
jgi:hypothetical protein